MGAHGNIGSDGKRLTKVEDKPTQFDTELAFYVSARDADDPLYAVMPDLIDQDIASSPRTMVLSDITSHVRAPGDDVSIMDVKLGRHSFGSACPNEPDARYYKKYTEFANQLPAERVAELWRSIGHAASGPPSIASGVLGKRDYLSFRDASTTSTKACFRLTASKHSRGGVSQIESKSIGTISEFSGRLGEFLTPSAAAQSRGTTRRDIALQLRAELDGVLKAAQSSSLRQSRELVGIVSVARAQWCARKSSLD